MQRLVLPGGERSWTVLGGDHRAAGPAEEFLEYQRVQRVSPNTVQSYARALALWWQYLEAFGVAWDAVTLEHAGRFLGWLRTADGPQVVSIERRPARFAESTIAARLQAVLSCYRYHYFNGVAFGGDLVRLVNGRGGYKPVLEHVARRAGRRQAGIRLRLHALIACDPLFAGALAVGAVLRLVTMLAYPGALWFSGDSCVYVGAALRPRPDLAAGQAALKQRDKPR